MNSRDVLQALQFINYVIDYEAALFEINREE